MLKLSELEKINHSRCKSIYIATKYGLPVPYGYFASNEEMADLAKFQQKFTERYLTLHPITNDFKISKLGCFLERFDIKRINEFIAQIPNDKCDGLLLLSTGYKNEVSNNNYFFAIKPQEQGIILEGTRGSSSLLYHKGSKDYSAIIIPSSVPSSDIPQEIQRFVKERYNELQNFAKEFGPCIMEFGIINDRFFFFEAKTDINQINSTNIISLAKKTINGTCITLSNIDKSKKSIILAEQPELQLMEYMPFASGFIFRQGSLLCHLAILLREKNIPALIYPDYEHLAGKNIKMIPEKPYIIMEDD